VIKPFASIRIYANCCGMLNGKNHDISEKTT
jgi:hypothetical protein